MKIIWIFPHVLSTYSLDKDRLAKSFLFRHCTLIHMLSFYHTNFTGQASALGYDSGLYKYEFESEIETGVTLAEPQVRKAKVKAEVVLTAYTPCDFVLKVLSLSVSTSRVRMNY